jgi:hypothetical protein
MSAQPDVYDSFEDGDARKGAMLAGDQINAATGSVIIMDNGEPLSYTSEIASVENASENAGVRLNKYEAKAGEQWERDHDFVLIRYAEILLMQAECYVRLGSPGEALPFVSQVRARTSSNTGRSMPSTSRK